MLKQMIATLLLMTSALFAAEVRLALPEGWDCVTDASQLPKKVKLIAISPTKTKFTPSINLASEETNQTVEEYIDTAKLYHESEGNTQVTKLGQIPTKSGAAQLLQIDRKTDFGPVRFIQATLIEDKTAYVLTATCLRDDFASYCGSFFDSIKSFELAP